MKHDDPVIRLLREHGAVQERQNKHAIWRLPNGRTYTISRTPSDHRAIKNQLAEVRRLLGVNDPDRGKPGERRKKRRLLTQHAVRTSEPDIDSNALRLANLVPATLDEKVSALVAEIRKGKR